MTNDRQLLDERLADVVSNYVDLLNAGKAPDPEQYIRKHPDLADALRPLLKTAVSIETQVKIMMRAVIDEIGEEAAAEIDRIAEIARNYPTKSA